MKNRILIRIILGLAGGLAILTRTAIGVVGAAILVYFLIFHFKEKRDNSK